MIPNLREMTMTVRVGCQTCETFQKPTKNVVTPIITSRPMQLVMFDLFMLPFEDAEGYKWVMMMVDHFSKFKWACALKSKEMEGVAQFLSKVFAYEGNCERWHADNGTEFINQVVEMARKMLKIPDYTHGRPRNPQCQGLVERTNATFKHKILKMAQADGLVNGDDVWEWREYLNKVIAAENVAPLKVYGGLTPFFILRNRHPDMNECAPLRPEEVSELHEAIRKYQERQGQKMRDVGPITRFKVGEEVRVRAGHRETKLRIVMGPWSTCAVVHEVHPTSENYYKVRWTTRGAGKAAIGTVSKRYFPWTALKRMHPTKTAEPMQHEEAAGTPEASECEEAEDAAAESSESVKPMSAKVTLETCPEAVRDVLRDLATGARVPFTNNWLSCHVDVFVVMELAALAGAPWRSKDQAWKQNGTYVGSIGMYGIMQLISK
jgi:hypothetical protein